MISQKLSKAAELLLKIVAQMNEKYKGQQEQLLKRDAVIAEQAGVIDGLKAMLEAAKADKDASEADEAKDQAEVDALLGTLQSYVEVEPVVINPTPASDILLEEVAAAQPEVSPVIQESIDTEVGAPVETNPAAVEEAAVLAVEAEPAA